MVVDDLGHRDLAGSDLRGLGAAGADEHHHDARLAEHLYAQAILDVKPLELGRLVGDDAAIDAAVGHDAVDVEPHEPDALGELRVKHRSAIARERATPGSPAARTALPLHHTGRRLRSASRTHERGRERSCYARTTSRARCHTSSAISRIRGRSSSGTMFGPSLGARSGSGWVSRKNPSAPAAAAA